MLEREKRQLGALDHAYMHIQMYGRATNLLEYEFHGNLKILST
jgi:hypothetical protein